MLNKSLIKLIAKPSNFQNLFSRHSALFINGLNATENFVYITPHIDFTESISKKDIVQEHLTKRKANIDLNKVENLWKVYDELKTRLAEYESKKSVVAKELGKLIKNDPEGAETKKLKIQSSLLKENIKKLKVPLWSAEEAAVVELLKLPNSLHPKTPDSQSNIIHTFQSAPTNYKKSHLEIGKQQGLINFQKNENYYLKGDAALFELGAKFYFTDILKKNGYVQFSNPDFVKSVIVEGCGGDHRDPDFSYILHHNEDAKVHADSRLHLIGGGSLTSFMSYHAKNILYPKYFPLKYFSMGRQYIPAQSDEDSLFHVSQSSVVQLFSASRNAVEADNMFLDIVEVLKSAYNQLGFHYQLSILPADKLSMWESLRLSIEMFSTSLNRYVEVGSISLSGNFISKRLMFTYVENKESMFPHVISGTVFNVPKFLACVMEHEGTFTLPKQFSPDNWSINSV